MVECQWDSVVPFPQSPELTGLGVMFMGLIGSNSGLFRAPELNCGKKRKKGWGGRRREGGKKGIEKERKEGRKNKKDWRKDKKKEF